MGNCIKKEQAMQLGGEDWVSLTTTAAAADNHHQSIQEKGILNDTVSSSNSSHSSPYNKTTATAATAAATEVKIKITKKQLEELLGKTDFQGLSVQQVLAHLIKVSDGFESHQRSWRPALQSIPEVN